ncbi:MAG TPA: DUF5777 family beta-barrel protein [Sphingobacteriaceae bacterium]
MKRLVLPFLFLPLAFQQSAAQQTDSLMKSLSADSVPGHTIAAFKSSRLILSQTTTMTRKGDLDFKVMHRFGDIAGSDGGSETFWGLDNSTDIYLNLDYGISDRLNVALGRSKFEQLIDLQLKYAALRQVQGKSPVALALVAKAGFTPYEVSTTVFDDFGNRFSYLTQAIISRKFSPDFSLQASPTLLFRNVVAPGGDEETLFALGAAARYKFSKRFGIVADYYHVFSSYRDDNPNVDYASPLGVGLEIETGGHVFTLTFVNARAIVENNFIPNSTAEWSEGQYRFGFTISRMFTLSKKQPKTQY